MVSSSVLPENTGHGDVAVLILKNNQQTDLPKSHKQQNKCLWGALKKFVSVVK